MKKILISAFEPFNHKGNNYSAEVLRFIESDRVDINKVIIDVIYDNCFCELEKYDLDEFDFIIALGEARMRDTLTVESRAINLSSCSLPDNSGELRQNKIIDQTLPEYILCGLDFEKISEIAEISTDAGKFVCNNLYFHLLKYDRERTLFIHVPECNNSEEKYRENAEKIVKIIESL